MNRVVYSTQSHPRAHTAPPPRRPRHKPVRLLNPVLIVGGLVLAGFLMLTLLAGVIAFAYLAPERIAPGVQVGGVALGGQTADEATTSLAAVAGRARRNVRPRRDAGTSAGRAG